MIPRDLLPTDRSWHTCTKKYAWGQQRKLGTVYIYTQSYIPARKGCLDSTGKGGDENPDNQLSWGQCLPRPPGHPALGEGLPGLCDHPRCVCDSPTRVPPNPHSHLSRIGWRCLSSPRKEKFSSNSRVSARGSPIRTTRPLRDSNQCSAPRPHKVSSRLLIIHI